MVSRCGRRPGCPDRRCDPGLTADAFVEQIKASYAWTVAPTPADVPTSTVCSGVIEGVAWDPTRRYVTRPPYDNGLVAAIGNNRVEAISALLATRPALRALPNVERLLESLQAGLLPDYVSDLASVEEHLHEHGFARRPGGSLWQVQARRSVGMSSPAPRPPPSIPTGVAAQLNELNVTQAAADRADDEIVSRRQQIFADWTKYIDLLYGVGPNDIDADGDVLPLIEAEIAELNAAVAAATALRASADYGRAAVEQLLNGTDLELVTTEAPRYWVATDPVVLIAGDDAAPPARHGGDGRFAPDGMLLCRTTVAVAAPEAGVGATVSGDSAPRTLAAPQSPAPAASLAAPLPNAPALVAPLTGGPRATVQALLAEIGCQAPPDVTISGGPASPVGMQLWNGANPWNPLLLQWRVELIPDHPLASPGSYPTTLITDGYRLDPDAIDLDPLALTAPGPIFDVYDGTVGLGGRTSLAIATQIQKYLSSYRDDAVDPQLNAVLQGVFGSNPAMMAQALGGLRPAMRMRRQVLQIPVGDPLATVAADGPRSVEFSNLTVPTAVGDQNTTAVEPGWGYRPIIAGQLNVLALRLVDTFGQIRDIRLDNGALIRSSSLRPTQDPAGATPVLLRPRLAQPSRLNFRWLAADNDLVESNSDPASSPICGWVLFNHLDSSLMIYDARGSAIGAFSTIGPLWQGAPGASDMFAPIETGFGDPAINPHLRAFALAIAARTDAVGFVTDLLRAIDRAASLIIPKGSAQNRSTSALFGRPLAIVRAQVDAELHGLASIDESWDALRSTVTTWDGTTYPADRPDGGFADVRIPVRLGDISNVSDGLVGYFVDDGTATYATFYSAAADTSGHGVVAPPDDAVTVTPRAGSKPAVVTMLVDPRCSVHATTGLLPMKDIEIPPAMYADALQHIAVPFLVAPLVTGAGRVRVPVPAEAGWMWSWITRTSDPAGWSQVDAVTSPNLRAAFDDTPQTIVDGWLRLTPMPPLVDVAGSHLFRPSRARGDRGEISMSTTVRRSPVGFVLSNTAGEPALTIGDGLAVNVLSFVVSNQTAGELALFAGAPVPDGQSDPTGPTTLYLYFGNLLTSDQVNRLTIAAPGWVATQVAGVWALTPAASGSLVAGGSVTFAITHVDVDGPPQDGHFIVDYSRLGNVPNGFTHLPLARVSATADGDPTLSLQIGFGSGLSTVVTTVDATQPRSNSLSLQLSTDVPNVAPTWDANKPPLFHLSFLYEESTPGGALTTRDLAQKIKVSPSAQTLTSWTVDPEPSGEDPVWTLRPKTGPILGAGSVAEFEIDSIVSELRPGPTQLSVSWENIPGFAPGVATAVIQKLAPLTVGAMTFDPSWIPTGQSVTPTLSWSTTGDPTTLELVAPHDTPLGNAVATSMVSPVAVSAATEFTMRAMRAADDATAAGSATFTLVSFPFTTSAKLDSPEISEVTAFCQPADSSLLYVACASYKDFAGNASASLLIIDGTTKALVAQIDQEWPRPPGAENELGTPSVWIAPNATPGVDRLAMLGQQVLLVWDIAADHTVTKRSSTAVSDTLVLGFLPTGTIAAVVMDIKSPTHQFTVTEFDPLGVQPLRQLGPALGGDGLYGGFMITRDAEHIVYLGWIGPVPQTEDDNNAAIPGRLVVRKSRLADGVLVDEVALATWPLADFMVAVMIINMMPLSEMQDDSVVLYTPFAPPQNGSTDPPTDPSEPDPFAPLYGLTWMPLDGSGRSTMSPPGGSFRLNLSGQDAFVPPQYSPNGTDVVIVTDVGLWIAPANRPDLGVTVPVGPPLLPVVFSPDGKVITAVVQDPTNYNSFEIVTLTRTG